MCSPAAAARATWPGSSQVGMWPQPCSTIVRQSGTSRADGGRACRASPQASVTGTRTSSKPENTSVRIATVRALVARRGHVGAHQPRGRLGRHTLRVRHRARRTSWRPAQLRSSVGRTGISLARCARTSRPRRGPIGRDHSPPCTARHRQRPAGLRQLQRHPAAEGVPGHVGARQSEVVDQPADRVRQHPRRRRCRRGPGERPKPGRSTAITSRSRPGAPSPAPRPSARPRAGESRRAARRCRGERSAARLASTLGQDLVPVRERAGAAV